MSDEQFVRLPHLERGENQRERGLQRRQYRQASQVLGDGGPKHLAVHVTSRLGAQQHVRRYGKGGETTGEVGRGEGGEQQIVEYGRAHVEGGRLEQQTGRGHRSFWVVEDGRQH